MYLTFKNTSSYKVVRIGGILQLEQRWGKKTFTTPMIPVDIEGETKSFRTYGWKRRLPSFLCGGGCETYMLYERNLAKRVEGS